MGLVITFVIFCSTFISIYFIAKKQNVDLVRADYYEAAAGFDNQMLRQQNSKLYPVNWEYDKTTGLMEINFPETYKQANKKGRIFFYRPSDASQDFEIVIEPTEDNSLTIMLEDVLKGFWRIEIQWTVNGVEFSETREWYL